MRRGFLFPPASHPEQREQLAAPYAEIPPIVRILDAHLGGAEVLEDQAQAVSRTDHVIQDQGGYPDAQEQYR